MNVINIVPKKTKAFGLKPATTKPSLYIAKLLLKILFFVFACLIFKANVSYARYNMYEIPAHLKYTYISGLSINKLPMTKVVSDA